MFNKAFSRDGSSIVGPLIPHQIKTITIEKLKKVGPEQAYTYSKTTRNSLGMQSLLS